MLLSLKFLEESPDLNPELVNAVASIIQNAHPAVQQEWKWNTLCFSINGKVFAYLSKQKKKLKVGLWGKNHVSSPYLFRDLKLIGYYLLDELNEDLLNDLMISCQEAIQYRTQ